MGIFVNFEIVDNLFFFFWGRGYGRGLGGGGEVRCV